MDEDEQQEDVNPLLGGVDNVDNNVIETMFDLLGAYLSDKANKDNIDSDYDNSGGLPLDARNHGHNVSQCWTYLTGPDTPEVSISPIDGVDNCLLDRACQEVPAVLLKMKRKICGKSYQDIGNFSPGDCLKAFVDPPSWDT